jgi:hypothetical protein
LEAAQALSAMGLGCPAWVPAPVQLVSCRDDAPLEVCGRLVVGFGGIGGGLFRGSRRGCVDQCLMGWRWSWCCCCQKLSEMVGVDHTRARVLGLATAGSRRPPSSRLVIVESVGAEAQEGRLHDRGVIEDCL